MIEDTQPSEPAPSVETAPAVTSDEKIRSTIEAAFDKAQASSPNDQFARIPSEDEFARHQNHEPETDHSESAVTDTNNADTDYPPQSWKSEMHPVGSQLPAEAKA
jgi:hypothetical protein